MPDLIESAASGRAKCRGCGSKISKGELRFGEAVPNQFADGETTLWFHLDCAAFRRPEKFGPALRAEPPPDSPSLPEAEKTRLLSSAEQGEQHPRVSRLCKIERAPSGRAKCRCCSELIEKSALRIGLEVFDEGRFAPIGFIHLSCREEYFGCGLQIERTRRYVGKLQEADLRELERILS